MSKRFMLLAVVIILVSCLAACGSADSALAGTQSNAGETQETMFWKADIKQNGYEREYVLHGYNWQGGGANINFYISPHGLAMDDYWGDDTETINENDRQYTLSDQSIFWDGMDDDGKWIGGKTHTRKMRWGYGDYEYLLSAQAEADGIPLDFINTITASLMEKRDFKVFGEYKAGNESWRAVFKSGKKEVSLQIFGHNTAGDIRKEIETNGDMVFNSEDGFEYYLYIKQRKPDDINVARVVWNTDAGLMMLAAGVPGSMRNEVPEDVWSFVNEDTARIITEQLGAEILPIKQDQDL